MSTRSLHILTIIFVVFVIFVALSWWRPLSTKTFAPKEIDLKEFTPENVSAVKISQKGKEVTLKKDSGQWSVNQFKVSASSLKEFFEAIKNLQPLSLASRNPDRASDFEATAELGAVLSFKKGETSYDFLLGKGGDVWGTFYLKKQDSKNIYLVKGQLKTIMENNQNFWRDKTVVKIDPSQAQKIIIKNSKQVLNFEKNKDGKWGATSGKQSVEPEADRLNRALGALNPLEASGFATPEEEKAFKSAKNTTSLVITGADNAVLSQLLFFKNKETWLVQSSVQDTIFTLSDSKTSDILISYEEVFKKK